MRKSTSSLVVGIAVLLIPAVVAAQAEQQEPTATERSWEPCAAEMIAMGEVVGEAQVAPVSTLYECPCYDEQDLKNLREASWDLCVEGAYVDQVSAWFGPRTASGQAGYNVLVSRANPRCQESSCLYLHRHPSLDGMQQVHRRFIGLSEQQAAECRRLLTAWIGSRGGCGATLVADPE